MDRKPIITYYVRVKGRRLDAASCSVELVKSIVYPAIYEKDENGNTISDKEPIQRRIYNEEIYTIPATDCIIRYDDAFGWVADILNVPINPKIEAIIEGKDENNQPRLYISEDERIEELFVDYSVPTD